VKRYIKDLIEFTPVVTEHPAFHPPADFGNIRAVTYSHPRFFDKEYETFAFIGFPENVQGKVPAVVLVHGGGGHAYAEWVRIWNEKGYAAIAMDTEGFYPTETDWDAEIRAGCVSFTHDIPAGFMREGLASSPLNDLMNSATEPIEKQWMFHAVSKVILAQNILRSFDNVEKVGICGISWGSIITSIAIGYDSRFDFAVSIYGGGHQLVNKGFCGDSFRHANVQDLYLAEKRLNDVKMPVLFLCGDDDSAFSVDANSLSYQAIADKHPLSRFSIIHDFKHSHIAAWEQEVSGLFADTVCRGKEPLARFLQNPVGRDVSVAVSGDVRAVRAYYITKPIAYVPRDEGERNWRKWQDEPWKEIPCTVENGMVRCNLPAEAHFYFITLEGKREDAVYWISSPLTEIH